MRFVLFIGASFILSHWVYAQNLESFRKFQEEHFKQSVYYFKQSKIKQFSSLDSSQQTFIPWLDGNTINFLSSLNADAAANTNVTGLLNRSGAFALSGEGIICGIWEDGLVADHSEFQNRILGKEGTSVKSHATHVSGTILASGVLPAAKGMAPAAKAFTYFFDNDLAEMAALQINSSAKVSNHSYGTTTGWARVGGVWFWFGDAAISTTEDYKHGFYNNRTKAIDLLVNLSPDYTIVWPAGNDRGEPGDGTRPADCNQGTGYDCIIPEAAAKNVITVGASNKFTSYISPLSITPSSFTSFGPTDDGRIKPDIVAPGVNILSTGSGSPTQYINSSGTSMAAPVVTGSIVLLQELQKKLSGKQFQYSSTVKSLLIHTAKEAGPQPGPDYSMGWGLLDATAAATTLLNKGQEGVILQEAKLLQGETHEIAIKPLANRKVTITICWTDPEGEPSQPVLDPTKRMLVNDLDIRLIDDAGNVHFPWILNPTIPQAQATKGDNNRDNVEKIELETPFNRDYKILVSHKGILKNAEQFYSLWISFTPFNTTSKTLYRVGAGSWDDASKWSFTSGGAPANLIPGTNDRVIIDNRSLQQNETLQLTKNVAIRDLIILNTNNFQFLLSDFDLSINKDFSCSSPLVQWNAGKIKFTGDGIISVINKNMHNVELNFISGKQTVSGNFEVKSINVFNSLTLEKDTQIDTDEWVANSNSQIDFGQSNLWIKQLNIHGSHITEEVVIHSKNQAEFNFNDNNFSGKLIIQPTSTLKIVQVPSINQIEIFGKLLLESEVKMNTLTLHHQSQIQWLSNTKLTVESQLKVNKDDELILSGVDGSIIDIEPSMALCLTHAQINNVDLQGNAAISISEDATVSSATGWQAVVCSDLLMANFSIDKICEGSLAQPVNLSLGNPTQYTWTISSDANFTSEDEQPLISISSDFGEVTITLTISKDNRTHQASKTFTIIKNTLPENKIVLADNRLMSLQLANSYQWLANNELLQNENDRFLSIEQNTQQTFQVVTSDQNCSRLSEIFLITSSLQQEEVETLVFPNPNSGKFKIQLSDKNSFSKAEWKLYNSLGKEIYFEMDREGHIDIANQGEGVYFLWDKQNPSKVYRVILSRN
ncbi:MAG: S8 family serine peptidase [Cyclobacteriaceae bacterium]|nr:S8 family serine peptidase [Cyclobacteriaceae bacterium]